MAATIHVGTTDGLYLADEWRHELPGREVTALAQDDSSLWALVDRTAVLRREPGGEWRPLAELHGERATCLLPSREGLLVGTSGAHLFRLVASSLERVESFEQIQGRESWYTPWGGPPDTRSLAQDDAANVYVNVHVGGIPKSTDGGRSWRPTIDIHADVHQVIAPRSAPGRLCAATARGLAVSHDGGSSWEFHTEGLTGAYSRAVALGDDVVLVTASDGPHGRRAGVYRRRLDPDEPFERCREGLPEWFSNNIDTYCLHAAGGTAAFGTDEGDVYVSADDGATWRSAGRRVASVTCLLVA